MKKLLVASIAAAAFCGAPALAAPPAIYSWTGCYVGGNVGGGWSEKKFAFATNGLDEGHHTASGLAGGGQVGCDYQFAPSWVIGVQGMWDAADLTGSHIVTFLIPPAPFVTRVSSFGTVTGRLGYTPNPSTLIFGKAGVGWVKDKFDFICDVAGCFDSAQGRRSGFDLGVGIEWMFTPNWSLSIEYDHMFLGNKILTFTGTGVFNERIHQDLDKVLLGINFRFSGR